mmetsp:Transcript_28762/g.37763  ORF Transcript_28762/g.37763 Transcript_28762/m.37763 type:complete len:247 (+) Transcript_28762:184-924(+)
MDPSIPNNMRPSKFKRCDREKDLRSVKIQSHLLIHELYLRLNLQKQLHEKMKRIKNEVKVLKETVQKHLLSAINAANTAKQLVLAVDFVRIFSAEDITDSIRDVVLVIFNLLEIEDSSDASIAQFLSSQDTKGTLSNFEATLVSRVKRDEVVKLLRQKARSFDLELDSRDADPTMAHVLAFWAFTQIQHSYALNLKEKSFTVLKKQQVPLEDCMVKIELSITELSVEFAKLKVREQMLSTVMNNGS